MRRRDDLDGDYYYDRGRSRPYEHADDRCSPPRRERSTRASRSADLQPAPLTRSSTGSRRGRAAGDFAYEAPLARRQSTRESSGSRPLPPPGYNYVYSMGTSGGARANNPVIDVSAGNVIEVVEAHDVSPLRERRRSSRDEDMGSSSDRRHGRRPVVGEGVGSRRFLTPSDGGSGRNTSRTPDRSTSSRQGRRQVADVIEDSRPPISGNRPSMHRRHKSTDAVGGEEPKARGSSRSRAGSGSGSGILSSIFGGSSSSRQGSPEKRSKEARPPKTRVACVICMSDVSLSKASHLKCGHFMCRSCLERIFKLSVSDPQHMPPRCCTQEHIPLKHVEKIFDTAFKKTWNRKFEEYSTKNRVYCTSKKCGEWIKPENIRKEGGYKVARCGRCKTKVCCACAGRWHGPGPCPKDSATAKLLAKAKEEGWKRCYKCKALVELKEGCNHMTCRCGAEFCMLCGSRWKSCDCPWFSEDIRGGDYLEDMNIPQRNDPTPAVRAQSAPMPLPLRPRNYPEAVHAQRAREPDNSGFARPSQNYSVDYVFIDEPGDVLGIGNAAGHYMNEHYRRPQYQVVRPSPAPPPVSDSWRTRLGLPSRTSSGREQDVGARSSRAYEDEAAVRAPNGVRSRSARPRPLSSDLAGLNVRGRGEHRVSQWRNFVEPGVPDGESTIGHA